MSFEGQKEGFASMKAKISTCRSGVMLPLLFPIHQVRNPNMQSKYRVVVPADISKVATLTTLHEESVG